MCSVEALLWRVDGCSRGAAACAGSLVPLRVDCAPRLEFAWTAAHLAAPATVACLPKRVALLASHGRRLLASASRSISALVPDARLVAARSGGQNLDELWAARRGGARMRPSCGGGLGDLSGIRLGRPRRRRPRFGLGQTSTSASRPARAPRPALSAEARSQHTRYVVRDASQHTV